MNDKLVIEPNKDHIVDLKYNEGREMEGKYGAYWIWSAVQGGVEKTLFVNTESFNQKLEEAAKVSFKVNIRKEENAPGKYGYNVEPVESCSNPNISPQHTFDARTHDIHRQVALKLAVNFDDKLTAQELEIMKYNTHMILEVLEAEDNLPF